MITHDHFDGQKTWDYPDSDRKSALARLARLKGRPVLASGGGNDFLRDRTELADFTFLRPPVSKIFTIPEGKVIHPHTDLSGRPSMGSWLHYGLGSENDDLPSFVVMVSNERGGQPLTSALWGSGFLPGKYDGVELRAAKDAVLYLNSQTSCR